MAAAIAPGTPAAAPAAPAPATAEPAGEVVTAESHGLAALLGDLTAEDAEPAKETPAGEPEEGAEPAEASDTEAAEPPDPAKGLDDEVIFSDKALETKEGVLRAKDRVRQLRKLQHEKYVELKGFDQRVRGRHARLKASIDKFVTEKNTHQLLLNNVRSNLQGLHSGDPDTILTALGNLTGQDGFKAFEQLNSRLINRGKPTLDPQIQAVIDGLQRQVEELKGGLGERETLAKKQQLESRINQHAQAIGARITGDAQQLPHLARLYAEDPNGVTEYIIDEIDKRHAAGAPVDGRQYFVHLESQLAKHFSAGQAPQGDGGGPAQKQPAPVAQRSPGQSVGPRTAAASTPRTPTEDEALRALSQDEAFMSSLFG